PVRIRLAAAGAAVVTVGAGLGLRAVAAGDVAKYGGDALYTVLVLALVVLAAPRRSPRRAVATALAGSWAVEFFQLAPVPAALGAHGTAARLVLGSPFNAPTCSGTRPARRRALSCTPPCAAVACDQRHWRTEPPVAGARGRGAAAPDGPFGRGSRPQA
ncbi:DUF2809 domain-containing protein, partial [Streptomyces sp. NPDC048551]|uniref:ribosomal maturation YjgA family protein n=1 Tax=Streptomyces sp. NPDC048551 TaxID=3155758 RepID=UPI003423A062